MENEFKKKVRSELPQMTVREAMDSPFKQKAVDVKKQRVGKRTKKRSGSKPFLAMQNIAVKTFKPVDS